MQNKLLTFIREQEMIRPGDTVVCAISGGADSVALLFALYLLKEKLDITLEAAHFNHHLRAEEADRDERFVRSFCDRYDIPLHVSGTEVKPGKKGLEAAAREARYAFLRSLPGKIATAHTADDNAETVLLHLIRGTGLKGLGGIMPINGNVIRPMLRVTRQEVEHFLSEWCLSHMDDSSNEGDAFLRNRIRHHVMPLLTAENPQIADSLSAMAMRLRQDEAYLCAQAAYEDFPGVESLKKMAQPIRSRYLESFLNQNGVPESEQSHLAAVENLVFSEKPSARASLPGGITVARNYDRLEVLQNQKMPEKMMLSCPGEVRFGDTRVICEPATEIIHNLSAFTVVPIGAITVRSRESGDSMRLPGGTKSLKKRFIDRKIPAHYRPQVPVICDEHGVLGAGYFGGNLDRLAEDLPAVLIRFEQTDNRE